MISTPAYLYRRQKGEKDCAAVPPIDSRPAPLGTRMGFLDPFRLLEDPQDASRVAHCACVCWGGCAPDTLPLSPPGATPLHANSPSLRPQPPGQNAGTMHRAPEPWRPGPGPRAAPGPSARFFVAGPPRSIAPSPSPAAGKGHPRTGGGGAARGTLGPRGQEAFTPQRAASPARVCSWLGCAHPSGLSCPLCVSVVSTSLSVGEDWHLFLARSSFSSRSPSSLSSLSRSLSIPLPLSQSLTLTDAHLPPPSQLTTARSTPAPSQRGVGWGGGPLLPGVWGCRRAPTLTIVAWLGVGGASFPGRSGEGMQPPQPQGQ